MSRVGKLPIKLSDAVKVNFVENSIVVEGPKGRLEQKLHESVKVNVENDMVVVSKAEGNSEGNAMVGLYRSLINNMVHGVQTPFEKSLEVIGVGYKVSVAGGFLILSLGYSHDVVVEIPNGLEVDSKKNIITVSGADKYLVGQFAANIRKLRKPEPYKGKGVKYTNEQILRKEGKNK